MIELRNFFALASNIIGGFQHADWKAARKHGTLGILAECWRALLGTNTMPYFIPAKGKDALPAREVRAILDRKGVTHWGWCWGGSEYSFRVPRRQSWLARRVLLEHGVTLLHER